jgi:hypothetical protein
MLWRGLPYHMEMISPAHILLFVIVGVEADGMIIHPPPWYPSQLARVIVNQIARLELSEHCQISIAAVFTIALCVVRRRPFVCVVVGPPLLLPTPKCSYLAYVFTPSTRGMNKKLS